MHRASSHRKHKGDLSRKLPPELSLYIRCFNMACCKIHFLDTGGNLYTKKLARTEALAVLADFFFDLFF